MECKLYKDDYVVFKTGKIYSLKKKRFLKLYVCNGYYRCGLKNGHEYLHRILCSIFKPNPENKPMVDHINRNRLDNNLSNLRWVTESENANNIKRLGSIYVRKDRKRSPFRAEYSTGPRKSQRKQKHFRTRKEAEEFLKNIDYSWSV